MGWEEEGRQTRFFTAVVVGFIRQRDGSVRVLWGCRHSPKGHCVRLKPKAGRGAAFSPTSSNRSRRACGLSRGSPAAGRLRGALPRSRETWQLTRPRLEGVSLLCPATTGLTKEHSLSSLALRCDFQRTHAVWWALENFLDRLDRARRRVRDGVPGRVIASQPVAPAAPTVAGTGTA